MKISRFTCPSRQQRAYPDEVTPVTAARTTSLGDLLTVLGSTGLALASSPTGRRLPSATMGW